jgi:hypothetical protein
VALAAGVTALSAVIVLIAAAVVPQDADWRVASLGWAAIVAGPFVAAQCLRPLVPVALRRRWSPAITLGSWIALALTWSLSRLPALVTGPAALVLLAALLGGPFCGAWVATRSSDRSR